MLALLPVSNFIKFAYTVQSKLSKLLEKLEHLNIHQKMDRFKRVEHILSRVIILVLWSEVRLV